MESRPIIARILLEKGLLADKADAPISELLDFVAVGTVADCVSIARVCQTLSDAYEQANQFKNQDRTVTQHKERDIV